MSVFGSIMSKILGTHPASAQPTSQPAAAPAAAAATPQDPFTPAPAPAAPAPGSVPASSSAPAPSSGAPPAAPQQAVDVEAVLTSLASKAPQKLDWRHSIVDLMKLLDLDSSLDARKQLAQELGYTGQMNGSAEMNMWLHKQVMQKLAENGGKVPQDLRS